MRIKTIVILGALALGAAPVDADDPPVNWTLGPDHVGIWVDGTTTNNHPYDLNVDRTNGVSNVLSWQPPSHDDGRTLIGYRVYRVPDNALLPTTAFDVSASQTSYTDTTADFDGMNAYVVTAMFEDDSDVVTESLPSNPVIAHSLIGSGGGVGNVPECQVYSLDMAVRPYVFLHPECVIP